MFTVPQHLPRGAGSEASASRDQGQSAGVQVEASSSSDTPPDPALDLLQPLLREDGPSSYTARHIGQLRESLEKAVRDNKAKTHDLLLANFPSVSSHIQLSSNLQANLEDVRTRLSQLEKEIDPTDSHTSFLPPIVSMLNQHFSASSSRANARTHISTLKALKSHAALLKKLEEAVWCGRAADDWVVEQLQREEAGYGLDHGEELLKGTKVLTGIESRSDLLRSFAVEQITDGYHKAVSFSIPTPKQHGATLSVQAHISLQQPRIPRPPHIATSALTQDSYTLPTIYLALSRLKLLQPLLQNLQSRLLRDLVQPILQAKWRIDQSSTDNLSILRLESSSRQTSSDILSSISTLLNFVNNTAFPLTPTSPPERKFFIDELHRAVFQSVLEHLILPSLPSSFSEVPSWLATLEQGVQVENSFSPPPSKPVLKTFFESKAGAAWATQRRYGVADDVRRLILGGWSGWEADEKEKERDVVVLVEVEVEDEDVMMSAEENKSFVWAFDHGSKSMSSLAASDHVAKEVPAASAENGSMQTDDGWGFDEDAAPAAGPSQNLPRISSSITTDELRVDEDEADGWDLDPSPGPTPGKQPSPPKLKAVSAPPKPAREAKRLGKRVAKARATDDEYDPWGSGNESAASSHKRPSFSHDELPAPPEPPAEITQVDDGWGWDEPAASPVVEPSKRAAHGEHAKRKRKELREEKRTIRERYLVSVACERLIDVARRVLAEIEELRTSSISCPSFGLSTCTPVLSEAISDVFALYRALLPTHFQTQIKDVPAISFQAYNDAFYLATHISSDLPLRGEDQHLIDAETTSLLALSEYIFASQLELQRDGIYEALDDLDKFQGTADEKVFRKVERGVKGIVHNLESLARVLKPVIAQSTHTQVLGELISTLVGRMTEDIIGLEDITEVESNRLTEILKLVQPLETVFETPQQGAGTTDSTAIEGVVQNVRGWLKFCYISEILQANLVDITYLLDQGSLVDFTSDELVNLVRALFASSEKRDGVIDKIQNRPHGDDGIVS